MSHDSPAETRFLVRLGEPSFGERVLETLAAVGFDSYGIAALGVPGVLTESGVVEIVDRRDGRIVWRTRDDVHAIRPLNELIALQLRTMDVEAFAAEWEL